MISSRIILLASLLFLFPHTSFCAVSDFETSVDIQTSEQGDRIYFTVNLVYQGSIVGQVEFSYDRTSKKGYIARLHVEPAHRKKSFGSILLQFALDTLTQCKNDEIRWVASPFNLPAEQTSSEMLPKLIAFYQRHGAQMLNSTQWSAEMRYYPKLA